MFITRIYDEDLSQASWLIGCQATKEALVIDPERDIARYVDAAKHEGLRVTATAETHIHADFLSGSQELAHATGAKVYLSKHGGDDWSYTWPSNSDAHVEFVGEGDTFMVGNISVTVVHTPGHTPEHICFLVNDKNTDEPIGYATGDFVFVGDLGRPDLLETAAGIEGVMEASAKDLHASCVRFMEMEDYVQVWPAHGAGSACGKALGAVPQSTVGYEKRTNPPLQLVGEETAFVEYMLDGQPEPPLYFERMKRMNRDGCPILNGTPLPIEITNTDELTELATKSTVIDTRPWQEVRDGHLPGTIWSQANGDFHRFAGSFVSDEEEIIFVVSKENIDRALRNAIRIGLDKIVGWVSPETLQSVSTLETMPEISAEQFESLAEANVLDVRRLPEYDAGHIEQAINVAHTRLLDRIEEVDASIPYIVNCHGGSRSAAACMALRRKGFEVTNLAGGYSGWKKYTDACLAK
jgi:hydroxyacylglutathione hydrolase